MEDTEDMVGVDEDEGTSDNGPQELEEPEDPFMLQDEHELVNLESEVLDMWENAENVEPTDPYMVLKVKPGDSTEKLEKALSRRLATCGKERRGVACFLRIRYKRAYDLLLDAPKLKSYRRINELLRKDKAVATIPYKNGFYEGQVSRVNSGFVRSGKGLTILSSRERYEGSYKDDMRHGVGAQFWGNGDVYVGQWFKNSMSGSGVYYYNTGAVYSGPLKDSKRHGRGRLEWRNGAVYIGEFVEDLRTGEGYLRHPSRSEPDVRYIGQWLKNRKHGRGTYASESEGYYTGEFRDDQFHGVGMMHLDTGDKYEGQFVAGRLSGTGSFVWNSGDRYTGDLWKGIVDGNGEMIYLSANEVYTGQWKDNVARGHGYLVLEDNHEYDGDFDHGTMHGRGSYSWPSGCSYKGEFSNGSRHGKGQIDFPSGATWEGQYAQDVRHGQARFQSDQDTHEETWQHGRLRERGQAQVEVLDPEVDDVKAWGKLQLFEDAPPDSEDELQELPPDSTKATTASRAGSRAGSKLRPRAEKPV